MDAVDALSLRDIADLLFAARERIDFYWNFYVLVVIAVIGWFITKRGTLTVSVKFLVTAVFLIAASMNLLGLYGAYAMAEALRIDLLRTSAATPLAETRQVLESHSYLAHRTVALWTHSGITLVIVLTIWFGTLLERRSRRGGNGNVP